MEKVMAEPEIPAFDGTTMEGLPAFSRGTRDSYLQMLMTNTFGQAFYASEKEQIEEAKALHAAAVNDAEWSLRAAIYAREKGYMRSQPILALAHLAKVTPRAEFEDAFGRIIQTPKDLAEFAAAIRRLRGGEGGRKVKRAAGAWLKARLSPYWAIKYGADREKGLYSLRDLLCVYHPKFTRVDPSVEYLFERGDPSTYPEQIGAFLALKKVTTDEEKARLIEIGRLPHEVASAFAGDSPKVWAAIMQQAPIFALLRHLATLERHGALEACKEKIQKTFTSSEYVQKSKILPFRFLDAMEKVKEGWLRDALRDAAELALANVRVPAEPCAVFIDISSSMNSRLLKAAAMFGVAMAMHGEKVGVYVYNDRLGTLSISKRDSLLTQAEAIVNMCSGGTATHLTTRLMLESGAKFETMVLLSDEQQNIGTDFYSNLVKYRERVNPRLKCFIVNVSPGYSKSGGLAPKDDPQTFWLYGWSDKIVDFVGLASGEGFQGAVAAV